MLINLSYPMTSLTVFPIFRGLSNADLVNLSCVVNDIFRGFFDFLGLSNTDYVLNISRVHR